MGNELAPVDYPKPPARPRGKSKGPKAEKKLMGLESAAIAYVQMENGEYRYADGSRKHYDSEGNPAPNKYEVMRRAGYAPGSINKFDEYLGENEQFWELVELHRLRRTDPMFRYDNESKVWQAVGGEALRNLYERVFYFPHTLTVDQHIRVVKLILDAGVTLKKLASDEEESKADRLLNSIGDKDKREKVLTGYKEKLEQEIERVESLGKAHRGADLKEES